VKKNKIQPKAFVITVVESVKKSHCLIFDSLNIEKVRRKEEIAAVK